MYDMSETKDSVLSRIRRFQESMEGVEIIKKTEAYGYYYATLKDVLDIIEPRLKEQKIWYFHQTNYDVELKCNTVRTIVYCTDDELKFVDCTTMIDGDAKLGGMNQFMVEGSAITYFRRYHLTTLLGLTSDEDTDAGGKRVTKKAGRSVEASTKEPVKTDFVGIFTKQAENKTKAQFTKTFNAYKPQMDNDDIKAITKIMTDKYGNK